MPVAERPVALVLQAAGIELPVLAGRAGERLGRHHRAAQDMGDGARLLATEGGVETDAPELAHRHVRHRAEVEVAGRIHVVGLDGKREAMPAAECLQVLGVVLDHQFLPGQAQVPEKALGLFAAADDVRRDRPDRTAAGS